MEEPWRKRPETNPPHKPIQANESINDRQFPTSGLDVSTALEEQREGTTPIGVNVRAFEPQTDRCRGGSRPGLFEYLPQLPTGAVQVQHLNFIVDPQADALGLSFADLPGDDYTSWDDPLGLILLDGMPNLIDFGGSGYSTNQNTNPKTPRLRITAKNQTKAQGTTFTFHGTEFNKQGLKAGDSIFDVVLQSQGAASSAAAGTYAITAENARVTLALGHKPYKITYRTGKMVVTPAAIHFVQEHIPGDTFDNDVTTGNLLIALVADISFPYTVSDTLGNNYVLAVREEQYNAAGSQTIGLSLWYCLSASTGACTVSASNESPMRGVAEFSGVNQTSPLRATASNGGEQPAPYDGELDWDTGNVAAQTGDLVFYGVFSVWGFVDSVNPQTWIDTNGGLRSVKPRIPWNWIG